MAIHALGSALGHLLVPPAKVSHLMASASLLRTDGLVDLSSGQELIRFCFSPSVELWQFCGAAIACENIVNITVVRILVSSVVLSAPVVQD